MTAPVCDPGPGVDSRPQTIAERILEASRSPGLTVLIEESRDANLRWANSTFTTNGDTRAQRVSVIAVDGDRVGVVRASGVSPDRAAELAEAAARVARALPGAPDASPLVTPAEAPGLDAAAGGGNWASPPGEAGLSDLAPVAAALRQAFERAAGAPVAQRHVLYGFATTGVTTTYLASSTGLRLRHEQPEALVEVTGRTPDGARSSWAARGGAALAGIDVAALHAEVVQRLGWGRRRLELPAGRYETVLPPSAVADLMVGLYLAAGALDAHEGRSVFARPGGGDRVGELLSELPLRLGSDPAYPGIPCSPFVVTTASSELDSVFDNGLAVGATDWILEGRLAALVQTRHSARLTGAPVTPLAGNLFLEAPGFRPHPAGPPAGLVAGAGPGAGPGGPASPPGPAGGPETDLATQIAAVRHGVLLTCLWYIREVNPQTLLVTGLTRDGVFLISEGEVVGEVNNFRFNESPVDLLARVLDVGRTQVTLGRESAEYFPRIAMPALRVADFTMSSVSEAS